MPNPDGMTQDKWQKWHQRQRVWRHNGFFGSVAMAKANMRSIMDSDSATNESKHLARLIHDRLTDLGQTLKKRVDPKITS